MIIDVGFDFSTDAKGGDPDSTSPTLRRYHKLLWSKQLPNGTLFDLRDDVSGAYLYHASDLGEFFLGSDAITHSYKSQKRKQWLIRQIPREVDELFHAGLTIGAYILFPNRRIDGKHTINQARGVNSLIDDRYDLTLECIRRYYLGIESPLSDTLQRYKSFFDLFQDFDGYIRFFLLDDLIDGNGNVRFHLPFDGFATPPVFRDVDDYLVYKHRVLKFIQSRNKRIADYARSAFP